MAGKIKRPLSILIALVFILALVVPAQAQPYSPTFTGHVRDTLRQYAADTWRSFVALTYPSGLPSDNIDINGVRAQYTSPTNIGAYMWSTIAARDLQIITPLEATQRIAVTLQTLSKIQRHAASGMYYNWYDPQTGAMLTTWPIDGSTVYPFLSTVDNGWLATALIVVSNSVPQLRGQALVLLNAMNFGFFEDKNNGLLYGGNWPFTCPGCTATGYTTFDFGTLNTEPRISSYIGIAMGDLPPSHYFKMWRTFPDSCDWSWAEMQPHGVTTTYLGVSVYEGHYTYAGINLVPSWGGSMFEALMVPLFVPEANWGTKSWGVNHPLYVQAQIYHGMKEAKYGYWGFSPATNPSGGYNAYGVDAIGMQTDGYPSNNDNTYVDYGFGSCPGRTTTSIPLASAYTNGVVTPHASFLAMQFVPREAMLNLDNLRKHFDIYGKWGFWDSVNVQTGQVSHLALALDQGMVMASLENALRNNQMQDYFSQGMIQKAIRPLLSLEKFSSGLVSPPPNLLKSGNVPTP